MKKLVQVLLLTAIGCPTFLGAQDLPVDISSRGEKRFEGGVATAEDNVVIEYGGTTIYADRALYNPSTQEAFLEGRVRIYRDGLNFTGERALYNFETGKVLASDFSGATGPLFFETDTFDMVTPSEFHLLDADFTTHDSYDPDFALNANKVRVYPEDRVVMQNVTIRVGDTPVFWFPLLYQSLQEDIGFNFTPGYNNKWGAFILTQYGFPLLDDLFGVVRLDLRSTRGVAGGLDLLWRPREVSDEPSEYQQQSFADLSTYAAFDSDTGVNETSLEREDVDDFRYRVSLQNRAFLARDIYTTVDINYLSDELILEDFFESEFRLDPQPDNVIAVTNIGSGYSLTALARAQVNDFYEAVERLPEVALDVKRQPLFNSPVFYESNTSVSNLQRSFAEGSDFPDYDAIRFDTFHKLTYPTKMFGWLNVVPRAGARFTYYSDTGFTEEIVVEPEFEDIDGDGVADDTGELRLPTVLQELKTFGSDTRTVFNLGLEASFKVSREFPHVQNRGLGLDSLRHILQPYTNFSYVADPSLDPEDILQFDRFIPSTRLQPLTFPEFTSTDAIDQWTIWRLGMRNTWQTKRDGGTFNWMTLDTFFDVNIDNPYDDSDLSNLFNEFTFRPVPWASLDIDSQIPAFDDGFTEINTGINFMPGPNMKVRVGHRYLDGNPFFLNSNLVTLGAYYRLNENWGFSFSEQYEFDDSVLEEQAYTIHRDLTSWVAALSAVVRDNRGENEFGVFLTFTLKDFPRLALDFPLSAGAAGGLDE